MANLLTHVVIRNFRSLADITLDIGKLNVLFGPNGAGKSTFLDTIWFVRDCAIRGVDLASSDRSHGIGALWDGADSGANISIRLDTNLAEYTVDFGYSSGRIEPFVGETLYSKTRELCLIDRKIGSDRADFYHNNLRQMASLQLRQPEKLALTRYLDFEDTSNEAVEMDRLLRYVHRYEARNTDVYSLKKRGSESSYQTWVWDRGQNLWSVVRNLHDRRSIDERYDTIMDFMKESFPNFEDVLIDQTGPTTVYASFIERYRHQPIQASGVSDGHLQMLIHLTCLFAEGKGRDSMLLFDEPESSLHPHAIATFAKAVKEATLNWDKQIFIATHSPVLLSQFDTQDILTTVLDGTGKTIMARLSEMTEIQDLLEQYAAGSLYMAEMVAPQSTFLQKDAS